MILSLQLPDLIVLPSLRRTLDDNCEDQVHDPQRNGHEDEEKERSCPVDGLSQGQGDLAPGVASDNLLEEGQSGSLDALESYVTSVALRVLECHVDGMEEFHRNDRPQEDDRDQNHRSKDDGLQGGPQAARQDVELGDGDHDPSSPHEADHPEDPKHVQVHRAGEQGHAQPSQHHGEKVDLIPTIAWIGTSLHKGPCTTLE
mmetsp:Transcript_17099/g.40396  ORF Transcript_17099/g.40396 Transcript_17099/m.40396 type:complete len:201 (+) Transcript_17099:1071-1673(+)